MLNGSGTIRQEESQLRIYRVGRITAVECWISVCACHDQSESGYVGNMSVWFFDCLIVCACHDQSESGYVGNMSV